MDVPVNQLWLSQKVSQEFGLLPPRNLIRGDVELSKCIPYNGLPPREARTSSGSKRMHTGCQKSMKPPISSVKYTRCSFAIWSPIFELATNGGFSFEELRPNWDKPRGKNIRLYMNCVRKYSELMFLVIFSIFSSILVGWVASKAVISVRQLFLHLLSPQNRAKNRKFHQKHQFWIFLHTIHI